VSRRLAVLAVAVTAALATACVPGPPEQITGAVEPPDAIDIASESVVRIRASGPCGLSVGTGFVIEGNRVVTNHHVVAGAQAFELETWDGRRVPAGGAQQAVGTDLAVIDLGRAAPDLTPLPFVEGRAGVGEQLVAVGYPLAGPITSTQGSLLDRRPGGRFGESGSVLRLGNSVRPGNSGGPLLDQDGAVVGVVFAYEIATLHALAVPHERLQEILGDDGALEPVEPC
jgi:S1-C subfamily serine protease